jgi:hypothetical protein
MANGTGIITQVVGPVVDVHFSIGDADIFTIKIIVHVVTSLSFDSKIIAHP